MDYAIEQLLSIFQWLRDPKHRLYHQPSPCVKWLGFLICQMTCDITLTMNFVYDSMRDLIRSNLDLVITKNLQIQWIDQLKYLTKCSNFENVLVTLACQHIFRNGRRNENVHWNLRAFIHSWNSPQLKMDVNRTLVIEHSKDPHATEWSTLIRYGKYTSY